MAIPTHLILLCRLALSVLWLFTAATSFYWGRDIGYEVLAQAQIVGTTADILINAGSALDAFIGLWLLTNANMKGCYLFQILVIFTYSLLLTIIAPSFWLHPFGPLTKNLPILALLYLLYQSIPPRAAK